jgi:hypothetical protein
MSSVTIMITAAERGGYVGHVVGDTSLTVRAAAAGQPLLAVSTLHEIVAWVEMEAQALGGHDVLQLIEQPKEDSTAGMAARHAPAPNIIEPKGLFARVRG